MADRLDAGNNPGLLQLQQEVASLRSAFDALKNSLPQQITAGAEQVLSTLTISAQGCQASGSGRAITIIVTPPTGGQINAVGVCEGGQMIVSGTVTFS